MEIFLNNKQKFLTIDLEYWENFALKALQILEQPDNSELSLTFVNDQEIQELNKSYRQIDKPTDVLSFPFDNSFNLPIKVLGDVIISTEKAQVQAEAYGNTINREIGFLMIHGILHLLGYDHQTDKEEKIMFDLQKKLLQQMDL